MKQKLQTSYSIKDQREYFNSGATLSYEFRYTQLKAFKQMVRKNENKIIEAVNKDFRKPPLESYTSEVMMIYEEINYMLKNLRKLIKPRKVSTPLVHFYSKSKVVSQPLGSVLIISPWNYPASMALMPLAGAIAAGNCAVIKPSEVSSNTSSLLNKIISETFDPRYIKVVEGGAETTQNLLKQGFDYCLFTGSTKVGKEIMKTAAETLTPVTLELGGKSPAIVTEDADLVKAASRIVWGKFLNAGQTCSVPDYIYVHYSVKNKLISLVQKVLYRFYGKDILANPDFPGVINEKHFERILGLLKNQPVVSGGSFDEKTLKIEPTIVDEPSWESELMKEEIFGPVLPFVTYENLEDVKMTLKDKPSPLALYLFTTSEKTKTYLMDHIKSGGVSVNDTLIHVANSNLPFGGVGNSGMGQYHGKYSFETFSNLRGVSEKTNLFDIPVRYAPYSNRALVLLKTLSKVLG